LSYADISVISVTINRYLDVSALANIFRKLERELTAIAMAPLVGLEKKETQRRIQERIKRYQQKKLNVAE
jgi:hypothetical protein